VKPRTFLSPSFLFRGGSERETAISDVGSQSFALYAGMAMPSG